MRRRAAVSEPRRVAYLSWCAFLIPELMNPFARRLLAVAPLAGIAALVAVTMAAVPPARPPVAPARSVRVVVNAETAINIDWKVLAGLDYTNGKATDTLKKLEGKLVRIPGFVVPLDDFADEGAEFLLVPYYGACVHTPPPPPNQIVMVGMAGKKSVKLNLFDAVWMSGRLKIASVDSPYGAVGYQLEGLKVEPYVTK
jgi:hypothetical protein